MSEHDLPHVVCTGNAFDGLALWGPFPNYDEALEYAEKNFDGYDAWSVVPINEAGEPVTIQRIPYDTPKEN